MLNAPPVHFVYPLVTHDSLLEIDDVDQHWDRFIYGRDVWIVQTFLLLRRKYPTFTLGKKPRASCINIIHGGNSGEIDHNKSFYFVNLVADKVRVPWVNYEIVQNRMQEGWKSAYIPHWPQPGLIKRKSTRKHVFNVGYLGAEEQNILKKYSVGNDFKTLGFHYVAMERRGWNDYSEIDIALAIRRFSRDTFPHKPPSKLINSWWAEVPLIAGKDSAYSQIGTEGEHYIAVDSYEQMLAAIKMLARKKEYYTEIVQNGIKERKNYSRDMIQAGWCDILEKKITPDFQRWQALRPSFRMLDSLKRRILRGRSV
ncbi:MAG: hypothetical protein D3911_00665 [Candidatus Electrothrix sp. AW3_4]|nr:hypothetical protein [Candidatus Electrothrix gigas]